MLNICICGMDPEGERSNLTLMSYQWNDIDLFKCPVMRSVELYSAPDQMNCGGLNIVFFF